MACAEAEPIPHLTSELRLRRPLHPRLLAEAWQEAQPGYQDQDQPAPQVHGSDSPGRDQAVLGRQQQPQQAGEHTLVLHLHTFIYGKPAKHNSQQQQQAAGDPDSTAAAVAKHQRAAEASLLAAVVGSDDAVAALPGGPTVCCGLGELKGQLEFGVLLWERLTDNLMQWPVWIEKQLYVVSHWHKVCKAVLAVEHGHMLLDDWLTISLLYIPYLHIGMVPAKSDWHPPSHSTACISSNIASCWTLCHQWWLPQA